MDLMQLSSVFQPAQVTDTERNFCFKVTSPVRILILQAESTQGKTDNEALGQFCTHQYV